jgi:hypothetical protein
MSGPKRELLASDLLFFTRNGYISLPVNNRASTS